MWKKSYFEKSASDKEKGGFHYFNGTFITPFSDEDFDLNLQDFNITQTDNEVNVSWTHVHPCITEYHVELKKVPKDSKISNQIKGMILFSKQSKYRNFTFFVHNQLCI